MDGLEDPRLDHGRPNIIGCRGSVNAKNAGSMAMFKFQRM